MDNSNKMLTNYKLQKAANNAALEINKRWEELQFCCDENHRGSLLYDIVTKHLSKEKFCPDDMDQVP